MRACTGSSFWITRCAGRHQRLSHIASGEDLLPDALGELVAPAGGPAAESGAGLEEQAAPSVPQTLGMLSLHHLGVRNAGQQHVYFAGAAGMRSSIIFIMVCIISMRFSII